jgi:nuclear pore complex protein Nup43
MNDSLVKINSSFVSERINKIRFVEEEQQQLEPTNFLTASSEIKNNVKLWKLARNKYADEFIENEYTPKVISKLTLDGEESTGLEIIDHNNFAVSCGSSVFLIYINRDANIIRQNFKFSDIHSFKSTGSALCTGISVFGENISSIGEDGRINILSANSQKVVTTLENIDSVTPTAVCFNYKQLITGNRMGILKTFDLRSAKRDPSSVFEISSQDQKKCYGVTSIIHHPTQNHIILCGSEEGSITVYDLRNPSFPASYLCSHNFAITELMFHPTQPDKLFSSSANGELWKWTQNMIQNITQDYDGNNQVDSINSWLNGERAKNKISITTMLSGLRKSITSIDCSKQSRLICSSNNEAVYIIDNSF